MKKKTNQKIRGKKKRKPGNKKFSQALIGGAFIALGCGCFAYPNFREWNTQREVEQIIDNFDKTYSQGLDSSIADKAADADGEEQNESQNSIAKTVTPEAEPTETGAGDSAAAQPTKTADDTDYDNTKYSTGSDYSDSNSITTSTRPYQYLYDEMDKYNKNLANSGQSISDAWSYEQQPMDLDNLNIDSDNPIIGYIEIPDMKIRLPLMIGASTENLKKGAAVLSQTSMPIGGESTNCVIAGHRGWEGSAYFQYIENMKAGSKVYITNPWETLVYECTGIKVIYPDDVNSILIQPGKDMITLFSCHPYVLGGGPYRYLVFCERVDTQKRQEANGILNPKSEEKPAENTDDITIADIPKKTADADSSEPDAEKPETNEIAPATATATPAAQENVPSVEDINSYRTFMGIDLLVLEQTLRYMLPVVIIVASILIIMSRRLPKGRKPKNKIKKTIKNNNAKRRKKL